MNIIYRHQQKGWVMLICFGGTSLVLLILSIFLAMRVSALSGVITFSAAAAMAMLLVLFSSMTVEIMDDELSWYFGPGFWKRSIALAEIGDAIPMHTQWYWGYGIKFFGPNRWLYNVSGLEAIEIKLRSGGWVRIGTDDTIRLLQALKERM